MRLVGLQGNRIGVVRDGRVVDLTDLVPGQAEWPPVQMIRLIRDFENLAEPIRTRLSSSDGVALSDLGLMAPIRWPNKVIAFPANYQAHIDEMRSRNRADFNGFFLKANSSISGPSDPIILPPLRNVAVHHECELALIIGREGRNIPVEKALDYVFGYSCLIDVTVRGPQERVARKSFDSFTPLGPWIVTQDEVPDPSSLGLRLDVNGNVRQQANTRDLIVGIEEMIAMSSAIATLEPGDIIATGTPEGVGELHAGDTVRIAIEGVGEMTVPVVQAEEAGGYRLRWGERDHAVAKDQQPSG